jgi:ATP/maltotriose-dependent transcriptional regulator MalT
MTNAIAMCEEAIEEATEPRTQARLLLVLSNVIASRGEVRRSFAAVERAAALAEIAGDPQTVAAASGRVAMLEWQRGGGIRADLLERASLVPPGILRMFEPRFALGAMLARAGQLQRARSVLRAVHDDAVRAGDDELRAGCLPDMALVECRAGAADDAWRLANEGVLLAREMNGHDGDCYACYWAAFVAARLGRVDDARAFAARSLAQAHALENELIQICIHDVLGDVAVSLGELEEAVKELEPLMGLQERTGWGEPCVLDAHHNLAEALVGLGRLEEAEAVVDELERMSARARHARCLAQVARGRALIAGARGDADEAIRLLERALEVQDRQPEPYELARTLFELGSLLRRRHKKAAARAALEDAAATFDSCGSRLWAENARAELRRIGGRPASNAGLTATEGRIADLVAAGRSNHEVAYALHVSPKTVEWNLSKIYRKLHVRSRAELGAKLRKSAL